MVTLGDDIGAVMVGARVVVLVTTEDGTLLILNSTFGVEPLELVR